jgi:hypothetical protein
MGKVIDFESPGLARQRRGRPGDRAPGAASAGGQAPGIKYTGERPGC